MTMLERVAAKLAREDDGIDWETALAISVDEDDHHQGRRDRWIAIDTLAHYRALARAALEALKEPDQEMRDAGWAAGVNAPDIFTSMIQKALEG